MNGEPPQPLETPNQQEPLDKDKNAVKAPPAAETRTFCWMTRIYERLICGKFRIPQMELPPPNNNLEKIVFRANSQNGNVDNDEDREAIKHSLELLVVSGDQVNNRRQSVNAFFMSANVLFICYVAFPLLHPKDGGLCWPALCAAGLLAALFNMIWWLQLFSLEKVSWSKIELVRVLESKLPARTFSAQYALMKENDYWALSRLESWTPKIAHDFFLVDFRQRPFFFQLAPIRKLSDTV